MRNFYAGAIFAVGMVMFGKGMYECGKLDERRRLMKVLNEARTEIMNFIENMDNEEKEEA